MITDNILIRKFRAPVYNSRVWIVVAKNIPVAIDKLEDMTHFPILKKEESGQIEVYTFSYWDERVYTFIFVHPKAAPGSIAHEAKHAVNHIFGYHGVKLSTSNDEHECYYLDMFVEKIHLAIKHYKKNVLK